MDDQCTAQGEVSGSFLLGLAQSFLNLQILPHGGLDLGSEPIDPLSWYPYEKLVETLSEIRKSTPSESLFFQAGVHFLRIWYEHGPGRQLISSGVDWLYANQSSGGYNSVVRGGTPEQIGWCHLQEIDLERGFALYENVMPLDADYIRGVFWGGCILFDDMDYVRVESECFDYPANPSFKRTMIAVHFHLKDPKSSRNWLTCPLDQDLEPDEIQSLLWAHKGLLVRRELEQKYQMDLNALLARSIVQLEQARSSAELANRAKSQFLATMSHEIRTPMNGILGMAQMLLESGLGEAERAEYVQIVLNSGQTLLTLLNDILDLSKIEAGQVELEVLPICPESILREIVTLFGEQARAKGIEIDWHCQDFKGKYFGADPVRLRQMISNLVSNALKFTAQGSVHISVELLRNHAHGFDLEFSVRDTGIGIPDDKMERLFKPFSQVDASTTRHYGGTGLGLSIVKNMAQQMGGDVAVVSALGKGSCFSFRIPAITMDAPVQIPLANPILTQDQGQSLEGKWIWIVEDNVTNQRILSLILAKMGLCYEILNNGLECVDLFKAGIRPNLILMDCQMPVMDGFEATQIIRRSEKENGEQVLPIIALTANVFQEDRQACDRSGMNEMISKPVRIPELQQLLFKYLK